MENKIEVVDVEEPTYIDLCAVGAEEIQYSEDVVVCENVGISKDKILVEGTAFENKNKVNSIGNLKSYWDNSQLIVQDDSNDPLSLADHEYNDVVHETVIEGEKSTEIRNILHCLDCNKPISNFCGKMLNFCDCKSFLQYECIKCKERCSSFESLYFHLKNKCFKGSKLNNNILQEGMKHEPESLINDNSISYNENSMQSSSTSPRSDRGAVHIGKSPIINKRSSPLKKYKDKDKYRDKDVSFKDTGIEGKISMYCSECKVQFSKNSRATKRGSCTMCDKSLYFQCIKCRKIYVNAGSMYTHLRYECDVPAAFSCAFCSYKAKQKGNLLSHVKRMHDGKECLGCGEKFNDHDSYHEHKKQCRKESSLKCSYCSFTCKYITPLKNHLRSMHKSRFECKLCGKRYKNFNSLQKHIRNYCVDDVIVDCEHCLYKTNKKVRLGRHLKTVHKALLSL